MAKQSKVKSRRKLVNPVFHLQTQTENDAHLTREMMKIVRQTGQLNLSGKHLSNVPPKMFTMYDPEAEKDITLDFGHRPTSRDDEVWWNFQPLTRLDLSSNVLTTIPEDIGMFQDLSVLTLQDNNLTTLPKSVGNLTKLTKLSLGHNKINHLPEEFFNLTELRTLSINHNRLETISKRLSDLVMLQKLDLSNNQLAKLPPGIGFLVRLTEINVSNNKLGHLPPDIVNLRDLHKLDISHNNLKRLPAMGELRKLQLFYAQHNDIEQLPDFEGCECIQEVYFGNNYIKEFPSAFCEFMPHLKVLELRDNQITSVPDEIVNISQLSKLDLTNNELTSVPSGLSLLPHLNNLKMEGNKIKQIRTDIITGGTNRILRHLRERIDTNEQTVASGNATVQFPDRYTLKNSGILNLALKDLSVVPIECFQEAKEASVYSVDLCKNKFTEIPVGLNLLSDTLTELNCSVNQLKELPECLNECAKLKYCELSNNLLTSLPNSLGQLVYLRELVLANNKIRIVPDCIYEMIGLEILLLNDNCIEEMNVEGFKKLTRLATLNLANNNINHVPPEFGNMTQLRFVELRGNSFRQPRYAILEQGTESVLSYLRDRIPK